VYEGEVVTEGKREGAERGTTEQKHPSHAVAAQLHFATSILPARLHSHSVDPFTEGMSHMPSSSLPPIVFPPPLRTPASQTRCSPPTDPVSVSHHWFSFYLIPSIPLLHPSSPTSAPLPRPLAFLSLSAVSFLSRSLVPYILPKCPSFSPTLLCDAGR